MPLDTRFAVAGVTARTPLSEAAPAMLLAKAEPLFSLEEAARGGADADAVHDMRVASRRLREAMRLLAPLYPDSRFGTWYRRARDVTRALGPVRDSDVFIEEFGRLGGDLGDEGKRAVAFMIGYRMGQREAELAALGKALGRLDLESRRGSFAKLAHAVIASAVADRPLADFARGAISERAAVVFGVQPAALDQANIEAQHALRIDYKRLRYAVEVFAPCYDDAFGPLHRTLTAFQDTLGELHDLHVFADMLRAPDRVEEARGAGVPASGLAEVEALIETRTRERFAAFEALAGEYPASTLLPALVRPLESASPPVPDADASAVYEDLPVASPVIVGEEPWCAGWEGPDDIGTGGSPPPWAVPDGGPHASGD